MWYYIYVRLTTKKKGQKMAYITKTKTPAGKYQIHFCISERVKGKKEPKQTRKHLGLLNEDTNELLLSNKISQLSDIQLETLARYNISYSGNRVPQEEPKEIKKINELLEGFAVTETGPSTLLMEIAQEIKLTEALNGAFDDKTCNQILWAITYEITTQNPLYRLQSWSLNTPFVDEKVGLSPASITRLCQFLGENEETIKLFFRLWIEINNRPSSLVCDNTSISSYGKNVSYLERGYNRDGEKLEQLNISCVFSRNTTLPLFYRLLPGSVTDITTINETIEWLKSFHIESFSLALDRGFFSRENLIYFVEQKIDFTIGVPCCKCKEAQALIKEKCGDFENIKISMMETYTEYLHTQGVFTIKTEDDENTIELAAHIYMDKAKHVQDCNDLDTIARTILLDAKNKTFNTLEDAKKYLSTFKLSEESESMFRFLEVQQLVTNSNNTTEKSKDTLQTLYTLDLAFEQFSQLKKEAGIFMILNSNLKASGDETLRDNKSRDLQEKIFNVWKNETDNNRIRVSSDPSARGKIFLDCCIKHWKTK